VPLPLALKNWRININKRFPNGFPKFISCGDFLSLFHFWRLDLQSHALGSRPEFFAPLEPGSAGLYESE
jgi:hypothetical protein